MDYILINNYYITNNKINCLICHKIYELDFLLNDDICPQVKRGDTEDPYIQSASPKSGQISI